MFPTLKALTLGQQEAERRTNTQGMDRYLQRSSGAVGTEISEHTLVSWFRTQDRARLDGGLMERCPFVLTLMGE